MWTCIKVENFVKIVQAIPPRDKFMGEIPNVNGFGAVIPHFGTGERRSDPCSPCQMSHLLVPRVVPAKRKTFLEH